MKHIILTVSVILLLIACNKSDNAPEPIVQQPITPTPTSTNGGTSEFTLYVWVYNEMNANSQYLTTPLRDLDTLFNSIVINGVNIVDSLKRDNANLYIVGLGGVGVKNNEELSLYSLRFNAPTDILATPFEITIDAKEGADVGGWSTAADVFMFIGDIGIGNMNINNFTSHCNGLNTYTVVAGSISTRYKLMNPCQ